MCSDILVEKCRAELFRPWIHKFGREVIVHSVRCVLHSPFTDTSLSALSCDLINFWLFFIIKAACLYVDIDTYVGICGPKNQICYDVQDLTTVFSATCGGLFW